jgi:large subunit ribosomal protein L10
MNRDQKAALVEELAEQIRSADAIFAVDYRGISVGDAAELRARLRAAGTRFRIVKNSLTERASDAAGEELLKPMLEGPTALAFVDGDAALAAKALNDMSRTLGTLEFKGGVMNGATLSADEVKSIARLPAREILHGQLVGTIAAPLSGLVRTLNALISGLAVQLGQIAEQGLVSGEAPSTSGAPAEASTPEATTPSDTEGDAAASDAIASDADASTDAEPEPEAIAEPAADAEPAAEPEAAEAKPSAEAEDATASESIAPQAEAEEAESEARPDSEADASAAKTEEPETDASEGEAEAPKED